VRTEGTRTVEVKVLGKLWMPMCEAAIHETTRVGSGAFEREIGDLADAEAWMTTKTGDLSQIIDYRITYRVVRQRRVPGVVGVVTHSRERVARAWKGGDESEMRWTECMWPGDEEDGEEGERD
jgi:hypothetical protein